MAATTTNMRPKKNTYELARGKKRIRCAKHTVLAVTAIVFWERKREAATDFEGAKTKAAYNSSTYCSALVSKSAIRKDTVKRTALEKTAGTVTPVTGWI